MGAIQSTLVMYLEDADPKLRSSPAIIDGPSGSFRGFTFEQLEKYTSCLAHGLREHGVQEGSVVGLMAPNLPEWALIFHATCSLGAVFMPCDLLLSEQELRNQLQHSQANLIITVPSLFEKVNRAATGTLSSASVVLAAAAPATTSAATPHLFVIGAAHGAKSFGALLQTGVVDWEFEASDEGRGSMAIMSEEKDAVYMYTKTTERQAITHGELLEVLLPSYGGDEDSTRPSSPHRLKNVLGLEDGQDVVAGCLPFWRIDGLIGVMLQSCFKLCTVVTFDNLEGRTVQKVIDDIGITVLPTTCNMLQKLIKESKTGGSSGKKTQVEQETTSLSSLCSVVCVTGHVKDVKDVKDGAKVATKETKTTETPRDKKHQETMHLFKTTFNLTTNNQTTTTTTTPKQDCTCTVTKTLTSLEYDTSPIVWPSLDTINYVMPAFFRQQLDGGAGLVAEEDNGLLVTTDITLVCSNGVVLDSDQVIGLFDQQGGEGQISSRMRSNGMTLEVSGPWHLIFRGLASCHALAHSMGSTTAVHTTMSMSSTCQGGATRRNNGSFSGGSSRKARRNSRSGSFSAQGSPSAAGLPNKTMISPEMRNMHAQLQQEEDVLKRERERHDMLSKQLQRTKNANSDMMSKNRKLKQEVASAENEYDVEKKRQSLSRQRRNSSPKVGKHKEKSPRNSVSSLGEGGDELTEPKKNAVKLSTAPNGTSTNSDQVSPVREGYEESSTDESDASEDEGRASRSSSGRDTYDENALQEELEEDMRRLLQRGVMLFSQNQANEAKPLFEEVVRIAHDLGNVAVEGRAVGNLASVFEATGQHHRAIELYMQCIAILRQVGDSRKEARILYNVSHSYLSLERYDEAIDYLNQSLALTDDAQTRQAVEQQLTVVRHSMIQANEDDDDDRIMDF